MLSVQCMEDALFRITKITVLFSHDLFACWIDGLNRRKQRKKAFQSSIGRLSVTRQGLEPRTVSLEG